MPNTVLRIDASARKENSITRMLNDEILTKLAPKSVKNRDLSDAIPQINETWLAANWTPEEERTEAQKEVLALSDTLIAEIEEAETLLIGLPIYNFGIPAALKAWIDQVARAGRTFNYTQSGPVGLLQGKRAIITVASGGTPMGSDIDFATGYMKHVLGFIGINDVEFIAADKTAIDMDNSVAKARDQISQMAN